MPAPAPWRGGRGREVVLGRGRGTGAEGGVLSIRAAHCRGVAQGLLLSLLCVLVFWEELNEYRLVAKAWMHDAGSKTARGTHAQAVAAAEASRRGLERLRRQHSTEATAAAEAVVASKPPEPAAAADEALLPPSPPAADAAPPPSPPPSPPPATARMAEVPGVAPGSTDAHDYESAGKVKPLTRILDLEEPGALEEVAAARAFNKELIMTIFNPDGSVMGLNLLANLAGLNMAHYFIIGNTKELCEEFAAFDASIACAWTSYLQGHPGLPKYSLLNEMGGAPFRLWWARFSYMARLADLGYNVMYVDTDVSFRVNPYPIFKGTFGKHNLLVQRERPVLPGLNIGIVYCQECAKGSGAWWVLQQTVQRMRDILDAPEPVKRWDGQVAGGAKDLLWDQHIFNDVAETAAGGYLSYRRSYERLQPDDKKGTWAKEQGYKEVPWENEEVTIPEPLDGAGRKDTIVWKALAPYPLPKEGEVPPSTLVAAPGWFFGGWSGVEGTDKSQGVWGWWNVDPPQCAMAHLVGAINKVLTLKMLGWWWYGAEALRAPKPKPWELPEGAPLLAVQMPGLRFDKYNGGAADGFPHAVSKLLDLGYASGRRVVLPQYDCASPFIEKAATAWHGIKDRERIVVGKCHGVEPCCVSLPFDCSKHVISQPELEHYYPTAPTREVAVSALGASIEAAKVAEALGTEHLVVITGLTDGSELPEVTGLDSKAQEAKLDTLRDCEAMDCTPPRTADFPHPGPCRRP
ncbi:nucleotide-diphospho-sugar transferase [Pycnococcus provasolii]